MRGVPVGGVGGSGFGGLQEALQFMRLLDWGDPHEWAEEGFSASCLKRLWLCSSPMFQLDDTLPI